MGQHGGARRCTAVHRGCTGVHGLTGRGMRRLGGRDTQGRHVDRGRVARQGGLAVGHTAASLGVELPGRAEGNGHRRLWAGRHQSAATASPRHLRREGAPLWRRGQSRVSLEWAPSGPRVGPEWAPSGPRASEWPLGPRRARGQHCRRIENSAAPLGDPAVELCLLSVEGWHAKVLPRAVVALRLLVDKCAVGRRAPVVDHHERR